MNCFNLSFGAPEETRTPDLLIRSQTLYPAELPAHMGSFEPQDIYYHTFGEKASLFFRNIKFIKKHIISPTFY